MGKKVKVEKFDTVNKAQIKGRVKHTRTGACTCRLQGGKCYHGLVSNQNRRSK